jgi:hypothetical protein
VIDPEEVRQATALRLFGRLLRLTDTEKRTYVLASLKSSKDRTAYIAGSSDLRDKALALFSAKVLAPLTDEDSLPPITLRDFGSLEIPAFCATSIPPPDDALAELDIAISKELANAASEMPITLCEQPTRILTPAETDILRRLASPPPPRKSIRRLTMPLGIVADNWDEREAKPIARKTIIIDGRYSFIEKRRGGKGK